MELYCRDDSEIDVCETLQQSCVSSFSVFTLENGIFVVSRITIKLLSSKETSGGGLPKRCPDLFFFFLITLEKQIIISDGLLMILW